MTEHEAARLRDAEARSWASEKTLSIVLLILEMRGVLDREELHNLCDAEHLKMTQEAPILGDGAKTEDLVVKSFRYLCGPAPAVV